MPSCCVKSCKSNSYKDLGELTFHIIPKNCFELWMTSVGCSSKGKRKYICSLHFLEKDFDRTGQIVRLRIGAIPTLNLGKGDQKITDMTLKKALESEPPKFAPKIVDVRTVTPRTYKKKTSLCSVDKNDSFVHGISEQHSQASISSAIFENQTECKVSLTEILKCESGVQIDDEMQIVESKIPVIDLCDDRFEDNAKLIQLESVDSNCDTNQDTLSSELNGNLFFLTPENISTICRICLKEKVASKLSEKRYDEKTYAELLEICSAIKLQADPSMSQNICSDCAEELLQAYKFREKCSSSEQTLIDFKAGLVKIEERDENIFACKSDVTMIHHDYSHNLGEEDVKNVTKVKCRQSKSQQENKKRFYLLERRLGDKKSVKLKEIDEANVKNLLNRNSALMKVNSRFRDVVAGVLPHGITMNDVMKDMILRNALIRNLNKRKMMIYTHITRPAANSIITSNSMIRKKSKALREQNKNPDQSSKPNDEESGIPTTSENAQELHNTTDECIQSVKAKNLYSNIYTCQYCKKIYRDKQQLKKHIERDHEMIEDHEKTENHTCKRCGQCFSTQNDLFVHQKKHSKGDYICKLCQAYFATLEAFVDHKKTSHDEKKAHCCEFCGQFFDYSGALRYHKNRAHLKGMRTFCQICDQGFRFKSTLARHMATHSTLQFDCKLCNKTFKKRDRLLEHIKSQHPGTDEDTNEEDEIKKLECDYCDKICYNKQSYSVHVWENHEGSVCIYCDTRLESAQELEEHLEAKHRDISDFSCRYCGKCYPELNILESHLDMHRVRFHQCEICHKRFSDASRLKIHMNTHTSNKLYECQYCEKTFRYITSRVIHERVHTGERPYVCDVCGKGFACQSTRKRHGETHTSRSMNE